MKNISNNRIVIGAVCLIVGLVIGWFIGHSGANAKPAEQKNAEQESMIVTEKVSNALRVNSSPSQESDSAILVVDQAAGAVAVVASVETDVPAWVVVREDKDGVVGNILGASRIDAGASNNIIIDLLRPTVANQTYQVVLFKDDGDKKFDHKIDVPLTLDGTLISKAFKTFAM